MTSHDLPDHGCSPVRPRPSHSHSQLLEAVQRYGEMEARLHAMVTEVQRDQHARVDEDQLLQLEQQIFVELLQLGLQSQVIDDL